MMKKLLLLGTIGILVSSYSFASKRCKLDKDDVIRVACTDKCEHFLKKAVRKAARVYKYKVSFTNLYNEDQVIDFNNFDAVIMPPGADIDPKYYISKVDQQLADYLNANKHLAKTNKESERRDPFEYHFLDSFFKHHQTQDIPLIGINRGMHMLAVSQAIPLILDIKEELGINNRNLKFDRVWSYNTETLFHSIMRRENFRAVQNHHQSIRLDYFLANRERYPHIVISAYSKDGLIPQAMEFTNRPVLGVQFHPEFTMWKRVRSNLFGWMLKKACERKVKKLDRQNLYSTSI